MSIESRLLKLESQNRRLRGCLLAVGLAVVGLFALGAADQRTVEVMTLRAQKIELIDPAGKVRGSWWTEGDESNLLFVSGNGRAGFTALCDDESSGLTIQYDKNDALIIADPDSSAFLAKNPISGSACLKAIDKATELVLADTNEKSRLICGSSLQHGTNIILMDKSGAVSWETTNGRR